MITQHEAGAFLAEIKQFTKPTTISLGTGVDSSFDLQGVFSGAEFILDVRKGNIRVTKITLQNRARIAVVLARVDIDGPPHTNPDGNIITEPHLHLFREGYDDKWAYPLSKTQFSDPSDTDALLRDFCSLCNIDTKNLTIQVGLLP